MLKKVWWIHAASTWWWWGGGWWWWWKLTLINTISIIIANIMSISLDVVVFVDFVILDFSSIKNSRRAGYSHFCRTKNRDLKRSKQKWIQYSSTVNNTLFSPWVHSFHPTELRKRQQSVLKVNIGFSCLCDMAVCYWQT